MQPPAVRPKNPACSPPYLVHPPDTGPDVSQHTSRTEPPGLRFVLNR